MILHHSRPRKRTQLQRVGLKIPEVQDPRFGTQSRKYMTIQSYAARTCTIKTPQTTIRRCRKIIIQLSQHHDAGVENEGALGPYHL